ncbi:carbohydrate esterase family 16 protein [Amniculicola lignicola CBS 123094]|uniref:Carbohydrate esterase family 16 protein n=1 Tax=Amniculicola lignicola CBS 123094 TaxID=1392246 RepID=A0A6A5VYP5_9PLEO|nr:carbohydrate esterase family 16 protein [Amniculicola lignicola CBS 123094]
MLVQPAVGLLLATYVSALPSRQKPFDFKKLKALVAFGDSYTYVQGLLGHTNYTYIGDEFNISFTPQELFSNRIVQNQTGTAEGGPNWVEYLTNCGVEPGFHDPRKCKIELWDFAFAGADISTTLTPLHHNFTVSLERQIEQFVRYGNPALSPHITKKHTLVALWIGINDINDLAKQQPKNTSFAPLYENLQIQQFSLVQKIYDLGYRQFLFMNLPPLNRNPAPAVNASTVATFNSILASHATAFQSSHPDTRILQYDANSVLNDVLDDYAQYGYKNVTSFCPGYNQPDIAINPSKYGCTPLDTYFWYNSGHMTSKTHEVLAGFLGKWLGVKSQ